MTDAHIRILRRVARQRRLELDAHDTAERAARGRRQHLQQSATRATERVAEAQARRRWPGRFASPEHTREAVARDAEIKRERPKGDSDGR